MPTDKERLDWLEASEASLEQEGGSWCVTIFEDGYWSVFEYGHSVREAIDEAMKKAGE